METRIGTLITRHGHIIENLEYDTIETFIYNDARMVKLNGNVVVSLGVNDTFIVGDFKIKTHERKTPKRAHKP